MKSNLIMLCLLGLASTLNAQDPRERHYYYEILDPRHEPKPLVEGFARERVTENLNRGLTVTPARDGKGIYLSWRLLASDAPGTAFHVYREADGKTRRLTKKPLTQTCDFMDVTPAEKASYWVEVLVKGKKSALSDFFIRISPSEPIPKWRSLTRIAVDTGSSTFSSKQFT